MRFLFLIGLCAFLAPAGAGEKKFRMQCASEMVAVSNAVVWNGLNHLVLQPGAKRYLAGILVEVGGIEVDGVRVEGKVPLLAIGGYRTQHKSLLTALELLQDDYGYETLRVLWMGELLVANSLKHEAVGRFTRANEVAGLWHENYEGKEGVHTNDVRVLETVLREQTPRLLDEDFVGTRWKEVDGTDNIRLMGRMNRFIKAFEDLKRRDRIPRDETYRHFIGNHVLRIVQAVEEVLKDTSYEVEGREEDRLADLNALLEPELSFECLYLYVRWLQNDGYSELHPLKALLKRSRKEAGLSLAVWKRVDSDLSRFLESNSRVNEWSHHVGEAQIVDLNQLDFTP
ncbi:MAG: hypothetical protein H6617_01080 [Bdellovibrionaceae bacterium]|nr:hypothetical protein [Bdellovibrionales bacterium]MCB9253258.1 hypothetical protein [Pseudobdellovibrionaceae bacterium]